MLTRRNFTRLSLVGLGVGLANCSANTHLTALSTGQAKENIDLTIWWEQGFLPEENEQVIKVVKNWEQQSGLTVDLKFLPVPLINQQLNQRLEEGDTASLPDIVYSIGVDASLAPKLSWRDQLLDLSDVVLAAQDRYTPVALSQVFYRNQILGERSYYALPLWQAEDYIHYWRPLIETLGYGAADVPTAWEPFWRFWQSAHTQLRSQGYPDLYGVGLCMSAIGFDTYTSFLMFLDAYNVEVINTEGEFLLAAPDNRQRMVTALTDYTRHFLDGYVPPAALEWSGGGNNSSFIDGSILMTQNLTLSIPLTQQLPVNGYNQDANQRYQEMVTIGRPQKPDGANIPTRKGIKQAIVPKACPHPEAAKDFLKHLIEPQNLRDLLMGFKGRVMPVMPQLFEDSLWSETTDPHLVAALDIYQQPSVIPYEVTHSAFSEIQDQQLWAKTVLRVLQEGATPQAASDWAIDEMQQIWTAWETTP